MQTLLLLVIGCAPAGRAWFGSDAVALRVEPEALAFGEVQLGAESYLDVVLTNDGTSATTVAVSVEGPFGALADTVDVAGQGAVTVTLFFAPEGYADSTGSATFAVGDQSLTVSLAGTTNPDSDQDGYPADDPAVGGDDCDDQDARTNPGVTDDTCYDGVDADCAGDDDFDCDRDGFPRDGDCDDTRAEVHPGAPDGSPENLEDDDCDGLVDEDLLAPGDLILTEVSLRSADGPWFELCNTSPRSIPLQGFVLRSGGASATLSTEFQLAVDGCAVACPALGAPCTHAVSLPLGFAGDLLDDRLSVEAGALELDAIDVGKPWGWTRETVYGLDRNRLDAVDNDDPTHWCPVDPDSKGSLNTHHC